MGRWAVVAEARDEDGGFLRERQPRHGHIPQSRPSEAPVPALPPLVPSSFPTCFLTGPPSTRHATTGHTQPVATAGASPVGVEESMVAPATAAWNGWVVLYPGWPLAY